MMVLFLYLVHFGLGTGTDLLMYNIFFEVFFADDLLVQRSHPLLKDLAELNLLGSSRDIGCLGFLLVYCKSVFNIAEIKEKAMFEARLLRFLHLEPAELYIEVQVRVILGGVGLWLVKEEEVLLTEDTVKDALNPIPAEVIFS